MLCESQLYAYCRYCSQSSNLAFDPVTGTLWDTENGDKDYDEINVVKPGFNSGVEEDYGTYFQEQQCY